MQVTLLYRNDTPFDIIGVSDFGLDMSDYTKGFSVPLRELKDRDPVTIAETLIQDSHNIRMGIRWVRPGDVFSVGADYYAYADTHDSFLPDGEYKLLPSWPSLIIFKVEHNVKI